MNPRDVLGLALLALLGAAKPARGFHRQTPPIVAITGSGDNYLPRLNQGLRITLALDPSDLFPDGYWKPPSSAAGNTTVVVRQDWQQKTMDQLDAGGSPANPTSARSQDLVAWDADCSQLHCAGGDTGRQIFVWQKGLGILQLTHDPTGTSVNAAMDGAGDLIGFESSGDLLRTGIPGVRQLYLIVRGSETFTSANPAAGNCYGKACATGTRSTVLTQFTRGLGTNHNVALSHSGSTIAFESTDDDAGNDTGISQIWVASGAAGVPTRITNGAAPSTYPSVSRDGRIVAFQSTASVATGDNGRDTGVTQIFAYDVRTRLLNQLTSDPSGCSRPYVDYYFGSRRVTFVCDHRAFYLLIDKRQRFLLPIPDGGDTAEVAGVATHFVVASTTMQLTAGQPTRVQPGNQNGMLHQLYVIDLFKLPPIELPPLFRGSPSGAFLTPP